MQDSQAPRPAPAAGPVQPDARPVEGAASDPASGTLTGGAGSPPAGLVPVAAREALPEAAAGVVTAAGVTVVEPPRPTPGIPETPGFRTAQARSAAQGRSGRARLGEIGRRDGIPIGLSIIWLLLVIIFWIFMPAPGSTANTGSVLLTLVGVLMPLAMIWFAALTARAAREMRAQAQALKTSVEAMRGQLAALPTAPAIVGAAPPQTTAAPAPEQRAAEPATAPSAPGAAQRPAVAEQRGQTAHRAPASSAQAAFASRRDATATEPSAERKAALVPPRPAAPTEEQPGLALGTPAEALSPPVSVEDFVRALNFPDTAEDRDGFRALRRALEDRTMAKLIRAAQDVLNLLAQDGIYMDDLTPDRARPELWRRFAQGERGREIAALGGVRDRSSLALTAGRMRSDTIFRDAAHHFLRQFDRTFADFEKNANDAELIALADTRTARAFMLLGRATGIFD